MIVVDYAFQLSLFFFSLLFSSLRFFQGDIRTPSGGRGHHDQRGAGAAAPAGRAAAVRRHEARPGEGALALRRPGGGPAEDEDRAALHERRG